MNRQPNKLRPLFRWSCLAIAMWVLAALSLAEHDDIPAGNGGCSSGGGSGEDAGFSGTASSRPLEQEVYMAGAVPGEMSGARSQNVSGQARPIERPGTSSGKDCLGYPSRGSRRTSRPRSPTLATPPPPGSPLPASTLGRCRPNWFKNARS